MNIPDPDILSSMTPDETREAGKKLLECQDPSARSTGAQYIVSASNRRDPEATVILAQLLLDGMLRLKAGNTEKHALRLLLPLANAGDPQARTILNRHFAERYEQLQKTKAVNSKGFNPPSGKPLVDFDGKE